MDLVAIAMRTKGVMDAGLILWFVVGFPTSRISRISKGGQPNIIILFSDDVGYGDFRTFGHPTQEWTGVDRMATEGRYPIRAGMFGHPHVFGPISTGGLPRNEITIPEALKDAGYVTGMSGKWHLGTNKNRPNDGYHLPHNHGFDYVGINLPISQFWNCNPKLYTVPQMKVCYLYRNDTIIEQPINLNTLTSRLVNDTKEFINANQHRPFFFLLSFPQAHPALFASPKFVGKSKRGLYGDSINEMGWVIEELLSHLVDTGIEKDTLVVFLSDQGPVRDGCGDGGSAGLLRGGKGSSWEGGVRVPAVAWWPGTIKPGSFSGNPVSTMDLFPTALELAGLTNYTKDKNLVIDGKAINDITQKDTTKSGQDALFFYFNGEITAVRYKQYKIHYFAFRPLGDVMDELGEYRCNYTDFSKLHPLFAMNNIGTRHNPPLIFNIDLDPEESMELDPNTTENKELLETVEDLVQSHKASLIPVQSEFAKPMKPELFPCCNPPFCTCNYKEAILPDPHKVKAGPTTIQK
ncbi:arylsulfatase-like [Styela clava]